MDRAGVCSVRVRTLQAPACPQPTHPEKSRGVFYWKPKLSIKRPLPHPEQRSIKVLLDFWMLAFFHNVFLDPSKK